MAKARGLKEPLVYLSLGAGVQSTALLVMSALGLHGCPKADVAIFADTGDEPHWVYEHLGWCVEFAGRNGIPLHIAEKGVLSQVAFRPGGFTPIPAHSANGDRGAIGRRQCTREYKLEPIYQTVRQHLWGLKPRERRNGKTAIALLGISVDEAIRMKPSRYPGITNRWPLIDAGMSRADCQRLVEKHVPHPVRKSSCVYCPFRDDAAWAWMRDNEPEEFARACDADERLRLVDPERPFFIHKSLVPLREVAFLAWRDLPGQGHLFDMDGFANECEGMCGV